MDEDYDIATMLHLLQNKIENLEIRVSGILMKQLQTKKELDLIQEMPEKLEDETLSEDNGEVVFPDNYHFTEVLEKTMENMISCQKEWMESVQTTKNKKTGLKGILISMDLNF